MEGKIMVASWGYSMILTTWVKVLKVSPKTLLVKEIKTRSLGADEMQEKKLSVNYLQNYTVPVEPITFSTGNLGKEEEAFRIYKRGDEWVGHPKDMSTQLYFKEWGGKPMFEDHCD